MDFFQQKKSATSRGTCSPIFCDLCMLSLRCQSKEIPANAFKKSPVTELDLIQLISYSVTYI